MSESYVVESKLAMRESGGATREALDGCRDKVVGRFRLANADCIACLGGFHACGENLVKDRTSSSKPGTISGRCPLGMPGIREM
jgi:hypothetical protein